MLFAVFAVRSEVFKSSLIDDMACPFQDVLQSTYGRKGAQNDGGDVAIQR